MSLDKSVQSLTRLTQQLNDLSDALNEKLREIEEQLEAAGIGVSAWLDEPITPIHGEPFRIGWGRHGRGWALYWTRDTRPIEELGNTPGDNIDEGLLQNAPRRVRIAAFPMIEKLVSYLAGAVSAELEDFEPLRDVLAEVDVERVRARKASPPSGDDIPF